MQYGADVNAIAIHDQTALHLACKRGNNAITELLLQYDANVNAQASGAVCFTEALRVYADLNCRQRLFRFHVGEGMYNVSNHYSLIMPIFMSHRSMVAHRLTGPVMAAMYKLCMICYNMAQ